MIRYTISGSGTEPLSNTTVLERAPSVFASHAGPNTSNRYSFIPTAEVLDALRLDDWQVVGVRQTGDWRRHLKDLEYPDKQARRESAPHQVTLARPEHLRELVIGGEAAPRLILTNAHDGQAAYRIYGGLFRLVCLNGLVVSDACIPMVRIAHTRTTIQEAVAGARAVLTNVGKLIDHAGAFRERKLVEDEAEAFGLAALQLRHGPLGAGLQVDPNSVLRTKRPADAGPDLWHTFNRVQEWVVRGGYQVNRIDEKGVPQTRRAPEIRAVPELIRLNRGLWQLAEGLVLAN